MGTDQITPRFQYRKNTRLESYDYSSLGAYFVTIVTHKRRKIFGEIEKGRMVHNEIGALVEQRWLEIPVPFSSITLDAFVVMPNHLHGIIIINDQILGASHDSPQRDRQLLVGKAIPLSTVIGLFTSTGSKHVYQSKYGKQKHIWQRNYYDHIIRDDTDFKRIIDYIETNPLNWESDEEYRND